METLLIVEDDEGIRTQMKWGLSNDYSVIVAQDRKEAMKAFQKMRSNVVILDLGLPPCENDVTEGMSCLKEFLKFSPQTKVIIVSGKDERENALQAVGIGAYDFYQKPVDLEVLKIILQRAFHLAGLEREYRKLQEQFSGASIFEGMIGCCDKMQEMFKKIKKVSSSDITVLITGESGTGKELVAGAIHRCSPRKDGPFVPINCASIPATLLESELFGYEKGAFTDAKNKKIGLVEKSSGGTLFLDEIGELPLQLQGKLLRFIQERRIQRLGGTEEIEIDLRLITATNVDLNKAVKEGLFREDLFFRISVIAVALPPLRERGEDILILVRSFLSRFCRENSKNIKGISPEAIAAIQAHNWSGNIRELENKIQQAVIMADGPVLQTRDIFFSDAKEILSETIPLKTLREIRASAEIDTIQRALTLHAGNISKTAETLGVTRPTLHDLINKYGLKEVKK